MDCLAIEPAVAWLPVLSAGQIRDCVRDRLRLLSRVDAGHLTVSRCCACLTWSCDLCTKLEQRLWARLSVSAGGFTLETVENVCGFGDLAAGDMLGLAGSLLDESVLVREPFQDAMRYRMLESVRGVGGSEDCGGTVGAGGCVMPSTGRVPIGNLPVELNSFVGRRQELDEIRRLLADARLLTLTGVGGTGKTRLALRVAGHVRRAFSDGVWFVDLTELRNPGLPSWEVSDPDVLAHLVAVALEVHKPGGRPPMRQLTDYLTERQTLLVLDNAEHLLPACALLAAALLRTCPRLRILATSRQSLGAEGEVTFAVTPLPIPRADLADLERCESVTLFTARARCVEPGFTLTADNRAAVAGLCQRLDGLPLAIELAASRVRVLTPQQILDRLSGRFAVLGQGARNAPARQQTLRACVDWSFELCDKPERLLWARLTVFVGGFEIDAAEGVCADEELPADDLLDLLAGLMEKSILVRDDPRDGKAVTARYRMLETIRDYGQEQLGEAGQDTMLRRRHRDWCEQLLARARAEWAGDQQPYWMARLRLEHPNLRAAIEFCLAEPGHAETAMRLAVTLPGLYWRSRGLFGEGRRWLDRALEKAVAPTALRARALLVNSHLAFAQGDADAGRRLLDQGEDLTRHLGCLVELAYADYIRGVGALYADDLPVAVESLGRARTVLSGLPDRDTHLYLMVLSSFCIAAGLADDQDRAVAAQQEMLAIVESRSASFHRSIALWAGGLLAWRQGDLQQATAQVVQALRLKQAWAHHDRYTTAQCLEVLAWVTADEKRHRRAAGLLGAAGALWTEIGTPITSYLHLVGHHDACERQLRAALGDDAFTDAVHYGRTLSYEDILAYAFEEPRHSTPAPGEEAAIRLTRRERQVAALVTQGLSNRQIAAELVISQRTAESHVEHILTKLGVTSRNQVAAWIRAQDLDSQRP
ncbi:ATP-binding protein [Actinoplanes xinjiangensis]|uniref:Putative ATPase n=1 Tax=Actinoplanes xinjiangensis TaxID=512350 RepID=A0A316EJN3_9ACTN|nr:LuxR C-terminal-related transcriptional regulator [Actinoplanes xinjiangensis]PWK31725.1 putative ATPase [Actinoplanes xinjiangensis]GIF43900.1 LuxR family transcriptional regulator [Actinoplanes xinjiangensis]